MPQLTRISALLLVCLTTAVFAASDVDLARERFSAAREDNAANANAVLGVVSEAATKAAALNNILPRRAWELLMADAQDALARMTSAEAQKACASMLPRLPPAAQMTLCFAMSRTPANEDMDAAATKLLVQGTNFKVLVAAMDMLAAHKYVPAAEKVAALLDGKPFPPVQVAACRALGSIPEGHSVFTLMKYVTGLHETAGGRFIYEAVAALRALTGIKLEPNVSELKRWWEANEKTFVFDEKNMQKLKANFELTEKADLSYYEIPVVENRMVIVLDISGSMIFGGKPNRLDRARDELKELVRRLRDKQLFNIVAFNTTSKPWKKSPPLVPATEPNKKDASAFLDTLKPMGGTATTTTLEDVMEEIAVAFGCESIYLVTDGNPNPWSKEITSPMQERRLSWLNQPLKLRINTVGIYNKVAEDAKYKTNENPEEMRDFLKKLAEHNDGVYKEVGKDGPPDAVGKK